MIRWSYGINQFKPQFDDFARRRQHERALRVLAASGFDGVELQGGSGRWEPLGNPTQIERNFGSVAGFADFVHDAALSAVSSWVFDPFLALQEDLTRGADPADAAHRDLLVEHALWFASALKELGGSVLVARPANSAGHCPPLDDAAMATIGESWNVVAEAISAHGIRLGLHLDCLSALRRDNGYERILEATDPAKVGLTLDTAELTIAGVDPVDFYRAHHDRVVHVQLKNASAVDDIEEYLQPAAEFTVLRAGGSREIQRWFLDLGDEGLVDSRAMVRALGEHGYDGWVVVESDLTPHPATSAMLNGWEVRHVLAPLAR